MMNLLQKLTPFKRCLTVLHENILPLHTSRTISPLTNNILKNRLWSRKYSSDSGLLGIPTDRWHGIGVDSSKHLQGVNPLTFKNDLEVALLDWKQSGVRVATMKIDEAHANLIAPAISCGFSFHHAAPGYAYLKNWLSTETDTFPAYANHYLGVAGFVVD
jgi:8-oxo-dGTP pyrophosphatase MutT (NUDIX family)